MNQKYLMNLVGVEKTFYVEGKATVGLAPINLILQPGSFISLVGPSGSGKTTLLNIIGGIDKPTGGKVYFNNVDITSLSQSKLSSWRSNHIGFIFQFYHLMPALNVKQNVEIPLMLKRLSRANRRRIVNAALELVGLEDRANHKPSELSGGQQQRVAIARALSTSPDLLLCDEPTGDLDRANSDQILKLLKSLNEDFRKTIVMVTHDPRAAAYAKNSITLDKGVVVEAD